MTPRAIIADDEPLLAADLKARLARLWPELAVIATCNDGVDALAQLDASKPDIAFLDIRMPGLSGIEVAARIGFSCHVVFVTAFDRYAVDAFERAAVDYVLKPATDERLAKTVVRLKDALAKGAEDVGRLAKLVEQLVENRPPRLAPLKWIRASVGEAIRLVAAEEVRYFQAADKYTTVVVASGELLIRTPVKELVELLDPEIFWQVHRGAIVNMTHVVAARHDQNGRVVLALRDRPEKLIVSRSYAHLFKQM